VTPCGGGSDGGNNNGNGNGGDGGNFGWGWNGEGEGDDYYHSGLDALPLALWEGYNRVLEEQPLATKAVTSLIGFTLGDILAQNLLGNKNDKFDFARLARWGPGMMMQRFRYHAHGPGGVRSQPNPRVRWFLR
jgi:hypothetical protein